MFKNAYAGDRYEAHRYFFARVETTGKVQKYSDGDGGGLYLHVSTTGGKLWRMGYRFEGKQKTLSFGRYPAVSLRDARQKREEATSQKAVDVDPGAARREDGSKLPVIAHPGDCQRATPESEPCLNSSLFRNVTGLFCNAISAHL